MCYNNRVYHIFFRKGSFHAESPCKIHRSLRAGGLSCFLRGEHADSVRGLRHSRHMAVRDGQCGFCGHRAVLSAGVLQNMGRLPRCAGERELDGGPGGRQQSQLERIPMAAEHRIPVRFARSCSGGAQPVSGRFSVHHGVSDGACRTPAFPEAPPRLAGSADRSIHAERLYPAVLLQLLLALYRGAAADYYVRAGAAFTGRKICPLYCGIRLPDISVDLFHLHGDGVYPAVRPRLYALSASEGAAGRSDFPPRRQHGGGLWSVRVERAFKLVLHGRNLPVSGEFGFRASEGLHHLGHYRDAPYLRHASRRGSGAGADSSRPVPQEAAFRQGAGTRR